MSVENPIIILLNVKFLGGNTFFHKKKIANWQWLPVLFFKYFRGDFIKKMSDWEEIRRLAADFQRAQLAGSAQKLSERNCIEIVTKLIGKDRVYRVPGFPSSRPNWVRPPSPAGECCPPLIPGGTHSLTGEGVGGPSSDEGTDTVVFEV
jgi:hypothetical protein